MCTHQLLWENIDVKRNDYPRNEIMLENIKIWGWLYGKFLRNQLQWKHQKYNQISKIHNRKSYKTLRENNFKNCTSMLNWNSRKSAVSQQTGVRGHEQMETQMWITLLKLKMLEGSAKTKWRDEGFRMVFWNQSPHCHYYRHCINVLVMKLRKVDRIYIVWAKS